jgi:hypothetical protein
MMLRERLQPQATRFQRARFGLEHRFLRAAVSGCDAA